MSRDMVGFGGEDRTSIEDKSTRTAGPVTAREPEAAPQPIAPTIPGGVRPSDAGALWPEVTEFGGREWGSICGLEYRPDGRLVGPGELGEPVDAGDVSPHVCAQERVGAAVGEHSGDLGVGPPRQSGRAPLTRCTNSSPGR